jgi:hypothetical protein
MALLFNQLAPMAIGLILDVPVLYRNASSYETLVATWEDRRPIPTEAAILAKESEVQATIDLEVVHRERRDAYGNIGAELDMLYWDQVNDTTTFKDHVAAVKAAHPKP